MKKQLEEIRTRFERGYTATLYGTVDLANFQKEYDFMELIQIVKKLNIHVVSKSVNCGHPMADRADIHNSKETYCLKCKTFI